MGSIVKYSLIALVFTSLGFGYQSYNLRNFNKDKLVETAVNKAVDVALSTSSTEDDELVKGAIKVVAPDLLGLQSSTSDELNDSASQSNKDEAYYYNPDPNSMALWDRKFTVSESVIYNSLLQYGEKILALNDEDSSSRENEVYQTASTIYTDFMGEYISPEELKMTFAGKSRSNLDELYLDFMKGVEGMVAVKKFLNR